jgi:arylsulfatase A-like enzyme
VESLYDRIFTQFGPFASVRDRGWHYFQNIKGQNPGKGPCLYDLKTDPNETTNVVEKHPDMVAKMKSHLEERLNVKLT